MTYHIKIFGCQMNYSDAERIATILEKNKFSPAASVEAANFIVFVTCGVRQSAEDRVYGKIHTLRKSYPEKKIILTGCLAHRKDVRRRLKNKVDLFATIEDFQKEAGKMLNTKYHIPDTKNPPYNDYLKISQKYTSAYIAYIPIMTGCNNFCAYCVVPYARGREYSRPVEDILKEVKKLVKKGYKEIILLGQNVNSYQGSRGNKKIDFSDLLGLVEKTPGNFWITFLTSHPKDMSYKLIGVIAKSKKICKYVSLPAQSGDDEVLRKMNRHYTVEHYRNLVGKIRKAYAREKHAPMISTDIIVGFPGETRKQFENTAKLLRDMKFDMAYIAQYSPRPETAALKMKDNVSKKEKVRREKVLTKILARTALENNKKYAGKIVDVLVDKKLDKSLALRNSESYARGRKKPGFKSKAFGYLAHTRTQKKVLFHSKKKIPVGSFVKVKITKAKAFGLEGEIK